MAITTATAASTSFKSQCVGRTTTAATVTPTGARATLLADGLVVLITNDICDYVTLYDVVTQLVTK